MKFKKILSLSLFFAIIVLNFNCESPKQGCNDPSATNFAFDADEPCDATLTNNSSTCPCVYPSLAFNFIPKFVINNNNKDSTIFWKNDLIINNSLNQRFNLRGFSFYISKITLENDSGKKVSTIDSILIPVKYNVKDSSSFKILKDIALFGQNTSNVSVGTFKEYGNFKSLTFDIGLTAPALNSNIFNSTMPNHYLNTDSMYLSKNYALWGAKFLIEQISPNPKKITITITKAKPIKLSIPKELSFKIAQNANLNLNFDFNTLFFNIDLNEDALIIENKILENFEKSLSIKQ